LVEELPAEEILGVPGVYDALADHFVDDVVDICLSVEE